MKFFWSFMLVLFAASMVVLAMPEGAADSAAAEASARDAVPTAPVESRRSMTGDSTDAVATDIGATNTKSSDTASADTSLADQALVATPAPQQGETNVELMPADQQAESVAEASEAEPVSMDEFAQAARAYLGLEEGGISADAAETPPATIMDALTQGSPASTEPKAGQDPAIAQAQPKPEPVIEPAAPASRVAVQPDGSLVIDDRITVPGDGSVDRPFVLEWSLLTSVSREYKPESGLKEIPEWLSALEGKRVRLTGHIVLPLVAKASDELLLTMNPWDGCCVGVPPTPYDAMEVTLAEAKSFSGTSLYGGLEGTFRVEPYVVSGWLLGLYLLDDARLAG